MKVRLEQIDGGEEEIIIRYRNRDSRSEGIFRAVLEAVRGGEDDQRTGYENHQIPDGTEEKQMPGRITAFWEGHTIYVVPGEVYYLESVDGVTYAYLQDKVVRIPERLKTLEMLYGKKGFFRCSKAMILNIHRISYLKSEPGSRIRATLENGEQVIISRKYGKELRRILKGGSGYEG